MKRHDNSHHIAHSLILLTCVMLFFTTTACSLDSDELSGDGAGYLFTASLESNPKTLDPQSATDDASMTIIANLYEGLVEQNTDGTISLAAADDYTVSNDGLTYTFTLNPDRYWFYDANGDDVVDDDEIWHVTAADYVYAFHRIFDPNTQSPYTKTFSCLKNANAILEDTKDYTEIGVHALNTYQVEFTLEYPSAEFLTLLTTTAAMPCNEDFFLATKGRYGLDQDSVAACGAFYLRLWFYDPYGHDNLIYMRRLSANTPVRSVYPSNITYQIRSSLTETTGDFEDETTDVLITPVYDNAYANESNYNVTTSCATTLGFIFNPDDSVFQNANIRTALSLAINRSTLADGTDDLTPASSLIPPSTYLNGTNYREYSPDPLPTYSAPEALEAFEKGCEQLGIASLDSTKILVCNELMDCDYLHEIIEAWQELFGFYIGIDEVTRSEYDTRLAAGDYTIAIIAITGEYNSPSAVLREFSSDKNTFGYTNDAVDAAITRLSKCASDASLLAECATLEQTILNDAYFIPIFYKNQYCVMRAKDFDIAYNPYSGVVNFRDAKHYT